ncbi:hypothetical protein [Nitrosopumilus sp.]|uniref:hypothetical protein n=1 Tax=Nitrosopumilus sp. TaxID=2024843 RepID=UPI003D1199A6
MEEPFNLTEWPFFNDVYNRSNDIKDSVDRYVEWGELGKCFCSMCGERMETRVDNCTCSNRCFECRETIDNDYDHNDNCSKKKVETFDDVNIDDVEIVQPNEYDMDHDRGYHIFINKYQTKEGLEKVVEMLFK